MSGPGNLQEPVALATEDRPVKGKQLLRDRIRDQVVAMIQAEKLEIGDRLLPEQQLAKRFDVSFLTVRAALEELAGQGIIERRPGSGTFLKRRLLPTNSLSTVADRMVAVVMATRGHFYDDLNQGIVSQLQAGAYMPVALAWEENETKAEREALEAQLRELAALGCRRIILVSLVNTAGGTIQNDELRESVLAGFDQRVQVGSLTQPDPTLGMHWVTYDVRAGHRQVIEHLAARGHRRIAYLAVDTTCDHICYENNRIYVRAYTDAMIEAGLAEHIRVQHFSVLNEDERLRTEQLRLLLEKEAPTAIFAMMDYRGLLARKALLELGRRVPEEIALVGFYNTPWSKHEEMTTVDVNIKDMAKAVRDMIELPITTPARTRLVQPSLIVRATTGG